MNQTVVRRTLLWIGGVILALVLLCVATIAVVGWNWLRGPIERFTLEKTGRALSINGDITLQFDWPVASLRASSVTFANPEWAQEKQMVAAQGVEVAVHLLELLHRAVEFPEVRLDHATVFLEQASDGRKSWLLDTEQSDENAHIHLGRVTLDHGLLGYDNVKEKTHVRAQLSTAAEATKTTKDSAAPETQFGLQINAEGRYKDLPFKAKGTGGPVLALRDTDAPYPLKLDVSSGNTSLHVDGTITGLLTFAAVDMRMALRSDNLQQLFPILGIAFPATGPYTTQGHLVHRDKTWRYEDFSGRIGTSDIAGFVQLDAGGPRPLLTANLRSNLLALDDLGPVIGARAGGAHGAPTPDASPTPAANAGKVLPVLPFNAARWDSLDAEVKFTAKSLARAKALPLEDLVLNLSLRDSVLTLDPLDFGLAAGKLTTKITLDGRRQPIQGHAKVRATGVQLSKLFPTIDLSKSSIGQINGEFDLSGTGNSVGSMLASSNGKLGLVVAGGQISKLLMEKVGLHLWEILSLKLTGDKLIQLRCAVADFDVKKGVMQANGLVFDTEVTTLIGTGSIDLANEQLDLTLNPRTKNTSPLALRSPIHVRGSFAKPKAEVDKASVAVRAGGAVALGVLNPLLALIPLIDAGPGKDSDCAELVRDAKSGPQP